MSYRWVMVWLAFSFAGVNNLHLPLLQVAAWAGMVIAYSQDSDLATAVEMTFDGDHPCPMCTAIKAQQLKAQPDSFEAASAPPLVLFLDVPLAWSHRAEVVHLLASSCHEGRPLAFPPETTPPRAFF
ncbi:MAG TPA: hypothetical protein PKE26_09805 [Kiritimatiellia bacterium]|nr:hypothetical protein [Kiritimatiellia bacterium]HMO99391.1 hypothetical protein [Kiritimatiellia bacterium]HMP97733.1 hypothetical protein [Kiritimatiellia bacterium]